MPSHPGKNTGKRNKPDQKKDISEVYEIRYVFHFAFKFTSSSQLCKAKRHTHRCLCKDKSCLPIIYNKKNK